MWKKFKLLLIDEFRGFVGKEKRKSVNFLYGLDIISVFKLFYVKWSYIWYGKITINFKIYWGFYKVFMERKFVDVLDYFIIVINILW